MAEALKCYIVENENEEPAFESHFETLPEVGDQLSRDDQGRFEIVGRMHHLNSRGWTDFYTLYVKRM